MARLDWTTFLAAHPKAHLLAGPVPEPSPTMLKRLRRLMQALIESEAPAGDYATAIVRRRDITEIQCGFADHGDAERVGARLGAKPVPASGEWLSERTLRLDGAGRARAGRQVARREGRHVILLRTTSLWLAHGQRPPLKRIHFGTAGTPCRHWVFRLFHRPPRPGRTVLSTLDMNKGDLAPGRAHRGSVLHTKRPERTQMMTKFTCDVLIVEDERIQCEEMASFLARAGLSVAMAHDGATGLLQARRFPPRVALLDYNLPDMTGLAARREASRGLSGNGHPDRLGPHRGPVGADAEGARHLGVRQQAIAAGTAAPSRAAAGALGPGQPDRAAAARRRLAVGGFRRHTVLARARPAVQRRARRISRRPRRLKA